MTTRDPVTTGAPDRAAPAGGDGQMTDGAVGRVRRRRVPHVDGRGLAVLIGSGALLVTAGVLSAGAGAYHVAPAEVIGALLADIGIGTAPDALAADVLWQVRFPRIVLAGLVGGALGCAGAVMQGIFGNPLAEPGIIGVSAGASVGAAVAIATGVTLLGPFTIPAAAFLSGLVCTLGIYLASRRGGSTEVVTLVLTGIAVNALAGAVLGLLLFLSDDGALRSITAWSLGSVSTATWRGVGSILPAVVLGLLLLPRYVRTLDLLALGDRSARHLGVDVERTRLVLISVVALLSAAAVAVAGVISFVGLVVPHAIRLLAGPAHRTLLPASALGGAAMLVGADLLARTVAQPAEVPLGVLTALVGAPCFLWLLRRTRRRHGGWA